MTNFEQILNEIRKKSEAKIAGIELDAQETIRAFEAEQKAASNDEIAVLTASASRRAESIRQNGKNSAKGIRQKTLLSAKDKVLAEILTDAIETMKKAPEEEYFSFLLSLCEKYHEKGEKGVATLSALRVPTDMASFEKKLLEATGGSVTLSKTPSDRIPSGLVLTYGKIECNLSFEALLSDKSDAIRDRLCAELFREHL